MHGMLPDCGFAYSGNFCIGLRFAFVREDESTVGAIRMWLSPQLAGRHGT